MADITMPQLGETVTEGTITKWFKQVGDQVAEDEVLFEVSTDKVDSEVPSPVAGYLAEIKVPEGETVDVGHGAGRGHHRRAGRGRRRRPRRPPAAGGRARARTPTRAGSRAGGAGAPAASTTSCRPLPRPRRQPSAPAPAAGGRDGLGQGAVTGGPPADRRARARHRLDPRHRRRRPHHPQRRPTGHRRRRPRRSPAAPALAPAGTDAPRDRLAAGTGASAGHRRHRSSR